MFTKFIRISLFASFMLLVSAGLYGQFNSKCKHLTLTNSILLSDSDKQYNQAAASDFSGTDDFDLLDDDDISDSLVKYFSFSASAVLILFMFNKLRGQYVGAKKHLSARIRLLSSLSFLQTFRV
ncbi:MAG: hypothetical protein ACXVPU_04705 [Bacteroidia bacterium]